MYAKYSILRRTAVESYQVRSNNLPFNTEGYDDLFIGINKPTNYWCPNKYYVLTNDMIFTPNHTCTSLNFLVSYIPHNYYYSG